MLIRKSCWGEGRSLRTVMRLNVYIDPGCMASRVTRVVSLQRWPILEWFFQTVEVYLHWAVLVANLHKCAQTRLAPSMSQRVHVHLFLFNGYHTSAWLTFFISWLDTSLLLSCFLLFGCSLGKRGRVLGRDFKLLWGKWLVPPGQHKPLINLWAIFDLISNLMLSHTLDGIRLLVSMSLHHL